MNLYQYLELREKLEEQGKSIRDIIDSSELINEYSTSNNSENINEDVSFKDVKKGAGAVGASIIQAFGYIFDRLGVGKIIGAKQMHRWGVKQSHIRYLKKKRKKFIKDLVGEKIDIDKEDDYLINPDLLNIEDTDNKKPKGKIIQILNNFVLKKRNFFQHHGVEAYEQLSHTNKRKVQEYESKIMKSIEKAVDELYELKTQEITKKINNSNLKEATKYALKYLWKILIVAIKPRIYSDLWELQILESKQVADRIQEYEQKLQDSARKAKEDIDKTMDEDIEGEKLLPRKEEIWALVDKDKNLIKYKFKYEKQDKNDELRVYLINLNKDKEVSMNKKEFLERATLYPQKNQVWEYRDKEGNLRRYRIDDVEEEIVILQPFSEEGELEDQAESKEIDINTLVDRGEAIKRKYKTEDESKGEMSKPSIGEI